ncbi:MAG: SDR family oxidoreductase [Bacteroidales bacterium]|jgi:NAD(P)-dependent dehydrogenase (short-subunit alcohol dehydrogenase family)|nr:SDR family oxidoreductase [Bacteroidales bacterium]
MKIVVTGASQGIGYEIVKKLLSDTEHEVLALARNKKNLKSLKKYALKATYHYYSFDLLKEDYHKELIPEIAECMGKVDVLINNAGLLISKPLQDLTNKDFDALFGINTKSAFKLVRDLLPFFNPNAHIVNISSMGGFQGSAKFPGMSLYSASKGALAILTECMAEELKEKHIKVNALAIGAVQTEMLATAFPGYIAPVKAEEMADFIINFAQEGHHFLNGKIIPVSLSTP